jgi:catechol 2,3-dioxygenase-like lactoylglutathione lyase family enzyme
METLLDTLSAAGVTTRGIGSSHTHFRQESWRTAMTRPYLQHVSLLIPPDSQATVRAFYGQLLGLEEKQPPASLAQFQLVWFVAGEGEMELHFVPSVDRPTENDQHICLVVDDLEHYRRRLAEANVPVLEAEPIPLRPRCFCRDPFGHLLELTTILGDYRSAEARL